MKRLNEPTNDVRSDPLSLSGQTASLLGGADAMVAEARALGADLHPSARHFLQQAEILLASARIEMARGDGRLVAAFAYLASEEAGRALVICTSPRQTFPGWSRGGKRDGDEPEA